MSKNEDKESFKEEPKPKRKPEPKSIEANRLKNASFKSPQLGVSPVQYKGYSPAVLNDSEKYGSRTRAGEIVFRYKCKDSDFWEMEEKKSACKVNVLAPSSEMIQKTKKNEYKYMFQKIKEVAFALGYLMDDTSRQIFEDLGGDAPGRGSLKHSSPDELMYLGRIRSDGRLTSGSVFFEGCLDYSDGHIVDLDLSAIDEYHVFPGQVVVLEGKSDLGKCLRVSKIHLPKPLSFKEIKIQSKQDAVKLNIMVAVGPYTPSDSMKYEGLTDLLKVVSRDKPDICILIGPFIEATHKMIENGEIAETFDDMFKQQMDLIVRTSGELQTQFVLVPSYKDVHGHLVYPTPPYSDIPSSKVTVLPDPASISIGGVVIGITAIDILMHLSKNELANSMISTDRMGRLARHVLSQRNFYPLYPCDESVPLDIAHWIKYAVIKTNPHILILPSDLRHFIKDVDGTIVVNPERLTKSASGGTFARIQVDLSSASPGDKFSSIADFCVGEIVKI